MPLNRSDRMTNLGELQLQVLDIVGRLQAASVYDVLAAFAEDVRPRYTTVLTVLRALEKKGLVSHTTRDRSYIYRPTEESANVRPRLVSDLVQRVFGGSPQDLVAALLDTDAVTPEVLRELEALVKGRETRHRD